MPPTLALPRIAHRKATLANGLDVIVRRQEGVPLVAVNLWYHVGSKNEERRQRGFAHLFEHLMFEGSEHYPGDFFKPLQRLGGSVNGSTSSDRTNYVEDLPSAHLELALAMESDRMGFLLPALSDEKLRIQKGVVQNEYRQNYANRPYGLVSRLMAEALYPPSHPYNWPTIGAMEDVEAASKADVEAFFRRFYVPANASLCLVGDLDEDEAFALADRYFGPLPGGAPALRPVVPDAALQGDRFLRLREPVELDRIHLSWHTVPQFHPDDAPLALLSDLLTRGRSSRLHRRLVLDEQVAQDVSSYHWSRELAGSFTAVATLRPGRDWRLAREAVDQAIADLAREIDPAELDRVKTGRLGAFLYALDQIGGFGGVADRLNAYNIFLGDPGRITSDFDRFHAVNPDDIRRVASLYLDRESSRTSRLELLVEGRTSCPAPAPPPHRATPPATPPPRPFLVPTPRVLRLACGAELWAIPRRDLPVISGTLVLRGGAGAHGSEAGGLAQVTAAMLDEGTTSRSASAIALAAESIATSLSASCGWDGSYIGFRCLAPHLELTLDLATDLLLNPTFPADEWDRVRGQTLAHLRADHDRADSRAYRSFLRSIYGPGHPYSLPADGSAETVERLGLDQLHAFHAARYRPDQAAWVVAGDIDPDQLARRLDTLLSTWSGHAGSPPAIEPPPLAPRRRIVVAHRPGAPQAAVRIGQVGIPRQDPDHLDLVVLNQILGGQFISRLNTRIREEKGLTYGIRSSFDSRRGAGPFAVASSIQADRVAEAIADVVHEIEALLGDRPPSPAELDDARRSLVDGQARQFETPAELVSRFAGLFLHGLPADHHATLRDRLDRVGPDSVVSAGARHLRPSALTAVVAADADQVAGPLQALGWAVVELEG